MNKYKDAYYDFDINGNYDNYNENEPEFKATSFLFKDKINGYNW
jgi:hypothetical protein